MTKFMQMLSRNLRLAAIIAIACVYAHPAFGQRVSRANAGQRAATSVRRANA